eukprot:12126419-Karenia_brevis.AAC.1
MQESTCAYELSIVEDEIEGAYTRDLSIKNHWYRESKGDKVLRSKQDIEPMPSVEKTEGYVKPEEQLG